MDIVTYALLNGKIKDYASNVDEWLEDNVDPATGYVLDRSLQMENAAAPADKVGDINDEVGDLRNTLDSVTEAIIGKNKFNVATQEDGYIVNNAVISSASWKTSDYIEVIPGTKYALTAKTTEENRVGIALGFMCTYGSDKSYLDSASMVATPYTVPSGVYYIRFSYEHNLYSEVQFEIGQTGTAYEPYTTTTIIKTDSSLTNENMPANSKAVGDAISGIGDVHDYIGQECGKNLYSGLNEEQGYLSGTGSIIYSANWKTSDYIDVHSFAAVTLSVYDNSTLERHTVPLYFLCVYDENKDFIEQVGTTVNSPYIVESGAHYLRFCIENIGFTYYMLEKGTVATEYEPYALYNYLKNENTVIGSHFYGKKWAVFGDSLTEKNARATKSYYDYIANELGVEIINYGVSGTGYARSNDNFMVRMLNINPSTFDVLTIFGSFNDAGAGLEIGDPTDSGITTLCGCINTTIDNFYSVAPYKPIGLVTPCPWASVTPTSTFGNQYSDAIIAIAKLRGIPYMDLFRESGLRPWSSAEYREEFYKENGVQDDGTHPNSLGHKVFLYPHFREFLKEILF